MFTLIRKLIFNPEMGAFVLLSLASFLKKNYMNTDTTTEAIETKQPLFLPRGTVRAIITLMLAGIVGGSFIWHYTVPAEFYALTIFAIGYYVGYRTDNTQIPKVI